MQEGSEGLPSEGLYATVEDGRAPRRKHRPGLQRTQIACQRCRARKNKCDGKLPVCTMCEKAGSPCIIVDRSSNRQYPRGHVEELEAQVLALQEEVRNLKAPLAQNRVRSTTNNLSIGILQQTDEAEIPTAGVNLASEIGLLSLEGASESRYVGESSGIHFGKIIEALLPATDYKHEQGPAHSQLKLRLTRLSAQSSPTPTTPLQFQPTPLPSIELGDNLQEAYFSHRWSSLPILHKANFLVKHFRPVMALQAGSSRASLFLTYMVLALGAIDLRRQKTELEYSHLDYFQTASTFYLGGLVENDNVETVQGQLLMSIFAINEPRSLNAWLVSGLALRSSIDLGLHRNADPAKYSLFHTEIRKRVFWSAYALDRNISIALGRPLCIQDSDINAELPLQLTDDNLLDEGGLQSRCPPFAPTVHDMSTFIHIIKLRKLNSKVQCTFYPTDTSNVDYAHIVDLRNNIRAQLEDWISSAPRYTSPTVATFQSMEWFQIAYNHALLLLYRPSPACPQATSEALQICADSSISLITLYMALYSKNKITYTWIALHSLFMASITMLYTLVGPEIRMSTTKRIVKSNIQSCLSLFENMGELWPTAAERCYTVIERLGNSTLSLFENARSLRGTTRNSDLSDPVAPESHFVEIGLEYMDWFGTGRHSGVAQSSTHSPMASGMNQQQPGMDPHHSFDGSLMSGEMTDLDGLFQLGFDMSLPLMTNAFGNDELFYPTSGPESST